MSGQPLASISSNHVATSVPAVDLIWNMTAVCPWDCPICCVDAAHVTRQGDDVLIRSDSLRSVERFPYRPGLGTVYEQAMKRRQAQGLELDFAAKLRILDNLAGFAARVDFSGGDPMAASENLEVLRIASHRFGRDNITLTATGAGLAQCHPEDLARLIGELNFTYDAPGAADAATRPDAYARGNLLQAAKFRRAGVRTRAECPLSKANVSPDILTEIYLQLHDKGIDRLLLMRLFPVGRGVFHASVVPTPDEYRAAIGVLRDLEARFGHPVVKLQCALRFFETAQFDRNPCDLVRMSLGLQADGTLLASPWAVNGAGRPLDDAWVLGNLARTPLAEIMAGDKARSYAQRLDENFGQCKIFAWLNSRRQNSMDRIFDRSDPLYASARMTTVPA